MARTVPHARHARRLTTLALLLAAVGAPGQAQTIYGRPSYELYAESDALNGPYAPRCGANGAVIGIGSRTISCSTPGGFDQTGAVSNEGGRLVARATADAPVLSRPEGASAQGFTWARAEWTDRITVTGPVRPLTVVMSMQWGGTVSSSTDAPEGTYGQGIGFWGFQAHSDVRVATYSNGVRADAGIASRDPNPANHGAAQASRLDVQTFRMALGPSGMLDFFYWLQASAWPGGPRFPDRPVAITSRSDLHHGARVVGMSFLDAFGRDITSEVTYAFANGTLVDGPAVVTPPVTPPITPVPEPTTWAMLLTGLGATAAMGRRRRAAR